MDLVRLAFPRRVYTQSHVDYVAEVVLEVARERREPSRLPDHVGPARPPPLHGPLRAARVLSASARRPRGSMRPPRRRIRPLRRSSLAAARARVRRRPAGRVRGPRAAGEAARGAPGRREGDRRRPSRRRSSPAPRAASSWTASSCGRRAGASAAPGGAVPDLDTVFRIASMTKSFTALAILKLRDEGKLSLDDPVRKWIPELAGMPKATKDSPEITIRHLLTHSEGFPEDNPWGDRQLARSDAFLAAMVKAGIPFSNAPGVAFEYSNTGFALLGRVVAKVSGMRYRDYVDANILKPLGMTSTYWEASAVPKERLAEGLRLADEKGGDGRRRRGGSPRRTGRSARWAASTRRCATSHATRRSCSRRGRRATTRTRAPSRAPRSARCSRSRVTTARPSTPAADGQAAPSHRGWVRLRPRRAHDVPVPPRRLARRRAARLRLAHALAAGARRRARRASRTSRTRAGAARSATRSTLSQKTGALKPRVAQPSPALLAAQAAVDRLYDAWDDAAFDALAADNLVLDKPREARRAAFAELKAKHGACAAGGDPQAENALRGSLDARVRAPVRSSSGSRSRPRSRRRSSSSRRSRDRRATR